MLFSKAVQAVVLLMATTAIAAPAAEINGEFYSHLRLVPSPDLSDLDPPLTIPLQT